MKKRAIAKFVKREDELPMPIQIPDKVFAEMRKIVESDMEALRQDYKEQLYRLDGFIKSEIGAIPRTDKFIDWIFKTKKIWQWGRNLPEISDNQIIDYAREYVAELRKLIKAEKHSPNVKSTTLHSIKWSGSEEQLYKLYTSLSRKFISGKTSFTTFKEVFSGNLLSTIKGKIDWKHEGKNGMVNKRSVYDLIVCLQNSDLVGHINVQSSLILILNKCFTYNGNKLTFFTSNLKNSAEYKDLEEIVNEIK